MLLENIIYIAQIQLNGSATDQGDGQLYTYLYLKNGSSYKFS
jgi:hypothetical protein